MNPSVLNIHGFDHSEIFGQHKAGTRPQTSQTNQYRRKYIPYKSYGHGFGMPIRNIKSQNTFQKKVRTSEAQQRGTIPSISTQQHIITQAGKKEQAALRQQSMKRQLTAMASAKEGLANQRQYLEQKIEPDHLNPHVKKIMDSLVKVKRKF